MAKNRNLGMGLDLLLAGGEVREAPHRETGHLFRVRDTMAQALGEDEAGNFLEAYYLYRRLIDDIEDTALDEMDELPVLLSQACNNAAIILYDQGMMGQACKFLQKSLTIQPNNLIAQENLDQLMKSLK